MGTFLPREYAEELEGLQDDVPPQSYAKIKTTFVASFGKSPHEVFASFERDADRGGVARPGPRGAQRARATGSR